VDHDRYRLLEFQDLRNRYPLPSDVDQQKLGGLLRRSELTYMKSKDFDNVAMLSVPLHIHLANSTAANVGRILLDLQVELRRTAAYQQNETIRPTGNNEIVEMISANHEASIDLVIAAAMEIYILLTSRPIDFLLLLDWCWTHRHNRTKVRSPYEDIDRTRVWSDLIAMARSCVEADRPTVVTMTMEIDGSTKFELRSQ
jgi:hypothetical protein